MPRFDVIAFDADDTLWHNERLYLQTQAKLAGLLAGYGVDSKTLEERLYQTENHNIRVFGYGIKSFTLSMIETGIELTGGHLSGSGRAGHYRPGQGAARGAGRIARACARGRFPDGGPAPPDDDHQGRSARPGNQAGPLRAGRVLPGYRSGQRQNPAELCRACSGTMPSIRGTC